jgi:hypothetical protein
VNLYQVLVDAYSRFVGVFPPSLQWLVTLLILIGFVGAVYALVRHHIIFLVLVIVLLPFIVPVLMSLLGDIYHFVLFLLRSLRLTAPSS